MNSSQKMGPLGLQVLVAIALMGNDTRTHLNPVLQSGTHYSVKDATFHAG
jgi:hypothetical protein